MYIYNLIYKCQQRNHSQIYKNNKKNISNKMKEYVGMSNPQKPCEQRLGGTQNLTNHFNITLHKYL